MYRRNFIYLFILISIPSIFTKTKLNSTITTTTTTTVAPMLTSEEIISSCSYCQTKACRCPSKENILNCSSYLLNLTYVSNCAEIKLWETVDFSFRNFDTLDSSKLLSLRMSRLLLNSNLISSISDHTFDSIGDILIELDLQMNQLSTISSNWLTSNLKQLKILNLALNQLETFENLNNIHLPQLQILNLSCNQMEIFPNQIQQWSSLMKLDLSFNKLSTVPRFAFKNLPNLTWLSLASNRYLTCIVQDSFKYLRSLKYLDVSSTNLMNLDGCIFNPLSNLQQLKIERVLINCSSCWLPVAKKKSIELLGQCLNNNTLERLDSLMNQQLSNSCSKSSIDCSKDSCEPGSFDIGHKSFFSGKLEIQTKDSNSSKNRTIQIIVGIIFSIIGILIILTIIIFIYRWRTGQNLLCCNIIPSRRSTSSTINERNRRQHQKQIIDHNPTVIESVVTHGANMNVPSYPYQNYSYSNETTANTKRKLYNPMFTDSPTSEIRYHQSINIANENNS